MFRYDTTCVTKGNDRVERLAAEDGDGGGGEKHQSQVACVSDDLRC